MSDEAAPPPSPSRLPWRRWAAITLAGLLALLAGAVLALDSDIGHRWIADRIAALKPSNGLRYSVGRIRGSVFSRATLVDVRISDPKGVVLQVPRAELRWAPLLWLTNRLDITSLTAPVATLAKLPQPTPTGRRGPILPGFDIHVGLLRIDRVIVAKAITGVPRTGRLVGRADVRRGRALVDLAALVQGSDTLRLMLDAEPDRDRFDIDVHARGRHDGVLAKLTGIAKPLALDITGQGRWSAWQGRALATAGGVTAIDLSLGNRSGSYTLSGALTPSAVTRSSLVRLATPELLVNGQATFANRRLEGVLALRSPQLVVQTTGEIDFANSLYRNLRLSARLLRPQALIPDMTGQAIELRAIFDGAFATANFDYRLSADRLAFGNTGFDRASAAGRGHLSKTPVSVPIMLRVANVTGVGDVAGGILRNFALDGTLLVDARQITGNALRFRSDKLSGSLGLTVDLRTGQYQVLLNGALSRYEIPGLGVFNVKSDLRVVPGPGGKGTRIIGTGTVDTIRLDNAFFASLAKGLPHITTGLEQTPDGQLHFTSLILRAPAIQISGNGYRRRDGTFYFDGSGSQATYGPLVLKLDGHIERPAIELALARPNDAMGLRDVQAKLDPIPTGYQLKAHGGSLLGDFTGTGQLLLPKGGAARIEIAALDAGGVKATGALDIVTGGLDGTMTLERGGITGTLAFAPASGVQRIEAHLAADRAVFDNDVRLRRGQVDLIALLDPDGASVDGDFRLGGLRRGSLALSRLTGSIKLKGGSGQVIANFSGSRGRAFSINSITDVTPDRLSITAAGTIDRHDAKLAEPAVLTRDGDGWRLAPARLLFAGGEAALSGRLTSRSVAVDAGLTRMPLSLLDIAYPFLGLSGVASGKLAYADGDAAPPTGKIDVVVRGLSRSGLVQTSKPIDLGLTGVLTPSNAAFRAVMASDGKTIGRGQARLAPLGQGGLIARLANAELFAQLRYDGPADTLWRLTNIEAFDLSGPIAVGADVTGHVNDPRLRGALRAKGARIESVLTGTVLTNVQATGQFSGSKLAISSLTADAGKGGTVSATGTFDTAAVNGFGMDLAVKADNAVLINRDDIATTVTGPLTIKSDGAGGLISGEVTVTRGRYRLGQAAAATAIPQLNIREINLRRGEDDEEDTAPAKPWRLDVAAKSSGGLVVTGLGLTSNWTADVRITGEPANPSITGRADLVRGTYEFAGREFALARGSLRFDGQVPANPTLDIQADANVSNLNATIRVSGEAARPQIAFTSIPALPEDELLSRLLFGTSITNLSAPEALQLASAVAALQGGGNGLNPINAVRKAVGLDRLRVLPADTTLGRGTSVAAGKYVTRRLYAEIITDGAGYSATQVEFQITRWLSLLSTVSTLGRTSTSIKVSKDY